jgi:hypothetical protein
MLGFNPEKLTCSSQKDQIIPEKEKDILKMTADSYNYVNPPMPDVKNRLLRRESNY